MRGFTSLTAKSEILAPCTTGPMLLAGKSLNMDVVAIDFRFSMASWIFSGDEGFAWEKRKLTLQSKVKRVKEMIRVIVLMGNYRDKCFKMAYY